MAVRPLRKISAESAQAEGPVGREFLKGCAVCNRFKGSDIASIDPETGQLTPLFHPRVDLWDDHYQVRNGEIVALTAKGRATVRLLRMNRPARIRERQLLQLPGGP